MCSQLAELPGPNIPLPCGYQAIAEHFAEGLDIRFEQRAQRVHYDASGVRVVCEDGAELRADAVVVTVSLGVLKVRAAVSRSMCMQTGLNWTTSLEMSSSCMSVVPFLLVKPISHHAAQAPILRCQALLCRWQQHG